MEQCFTLATATFPEGEVSEKTTDHAPSQPSLRRSSVRKRAQKTRSRLSNQWTIISIHQFVETQARPLLGLFAKRLHTTRAFVFRYSFDTPHRKEQRTYTDERFVMNYAANPLVKRVQVESAQEYSSRVNFVEYAPTFLTRTVKHD